MLRANVNEMIGRLDRWLSQNRPWYYAELNSGATSAQLRQTEVELGFQLPEAFCELYLWRNGQHASNFEAFHDNYCFSPLDQVVEDWRVMKDLSLAGEFEDENWWRVPWVPFLNNGGGDNLCLDMEGTFTGRPGQILEFWHEDSDRVVVYPSFEQYLKTIVSALEQTEWTAAKETWQTPHTLVASMNPGYPIAFNAPSRT